MGLVFPLKGFLGQLPAGPYTLRQKLTSCLYQATKSVFPSAEFDLLQQLNSLWRARVVQTLTGQTDTWLRLETTDFWVQIHMSTGCYSS